MWETKSVVVTSGEWKECDLTELGKVRRGEQRGVKEGGDGKGREGKKRGGRGEEGREGREGERRKGR